jgi:hypothetical protein
MKKLLLVIALLMMVLSFTSCTKCDCEVCCDFSDPDPDLDLGMICVTEDDVKKDDCEDEALGCTAKCK